MLSAIVVGIAIPVIIMSPASLSGIIKVMWKGSHKGGYGSQQGEKNKKI